MATENRPVADVPLNLTVIKAAISQKVGKPWEEVQKQEGIEALRVSKNVYNAILDGETVSPGTVTKVATALEKKIVEVIEPDREALLPDNPEFYLSLGEGYFIDHDRTALDGLTYWNWESITFRHLGTLDGRMRFDGKIENEYGDKFDVDAVRLNEYHFSLRAVMIGQPWAFDASFSRVHNGMLCGSWAGIDYLSRRMTVYRMFLTKKRDSRLTRDELWLYSRQVPIIRQVETRRIASKPPKKT